MSVKREIEVSVCLISFFFSHFYRIIFEPIYHLCIRAHDMFLDKVVNWYALYGSNSTWLDLTRLDTFDVSSPCILAVSS